MERSGRLILIRYYYVDPAEHRENETFLESITNGQFLMLMGARASGKSTRVYRLMAQLAAHGQLSLHLCKLTFFMNARYYH